MKAKRKRSFVVEIIREDDGKNYYVLVPALPGCFSQGKTVESAKKNILEAIRIHLNALRSAGEILPDPETFQTTVEVAA